MLPEFSNDWSRYIPIRLPHTVCITDRAPTGAAAVLLNRSHQFHDLVVVIDALDKQMFDAIDGRRTIAEIAALVGGTDTCARAGRYFERLWRFDQVVFDVSSGG